MKHRKIGLVLLLVLTLALSGCAQQSYFIKVNEDSSVNFAAELTITQTGLNKLKDLNIQREEILESYEPLFKQIKEYYTEKGFSYKYVDSDGQAKVVLKKFYPDIQSFNEEIKLLCDEGKSGLMLNIDRNTDITGSNTKYKGTIRFQFDPKFRDVVKSNPNLLKYINSIPLDSYLRVYDKDKLITIDNIAEENGEYAIMVNGTWEPNAEQPTKTFLLETEKKNETFALIVFFGIAVGIVALLVLVFGKGKKFDIAHFIKMKRLEKDDN